MSANPTITDERLKKLQEVELELLKTVDAVCSSNNIEYYLACGTLLGAIRHNGFIPWDDDVDIFMTRENYNKFMQLPENLFPETIHVRSFHNTDKDDLNISFQTKIESTNKKVLRKVGDKVVEQRIWIDVFVIDGMPKNVARRKLHYFNILFHQTLFRIARSYKNGELKGKKRGGIEKAGIVISHIIPIGRVLNIKRVMGKTEKIFSKYNIDSSDMVIAYVPAYKKKCIVEKNIFEGRREEIFEGQLFPIPIGAEAYLSSIYGDYKTLPPVEKRIASHCEDIVEAMNG